MIIKLWTTTLKVTCIGLLLVLFSPLQAQDIQFAQFYANVLYLNPAFAGSAHGTRLIAHQRLQWPSLDARYMTLTASADHYFDEYKSGAGIFVMKDWQGSNKISTSMVSLQYAYELNLNDRYSVRLGLEGAYTSMYVNYLAHTYPDQYTNNGFTGQSSDEPFGASTINYVDFSSGGIFYSDQLWVGLACSHINQPNQSFYGIESRLPMKVSLVGGYKFFLHRGKIGNSVNDREDLEEISITPTFQYKFQGKSDQFDIGLYSSYRSILLGAWYRGIPVKKYETNIQNNESVVLLAGWHNNNLSLSYSCDFTVSKLTAARTGGAQEINITYIFNKQPKKKKKMKRLPCPHFYK